MKDGHAFDILGRQLFDDDLVLVRVGRQLKDAMVTAGGLLATIAGGKRVPMPAADQVLLMVPRNGDRAARWAEIAEHRMAMRQAYVALST